MRSVPWPRRVGGAIVAAVALAGAGCDLGLPAGRMPHREGNRLDMIDQPKLTPLRRDAFGGRSTSLLAPPPGSVAVDDVPYPYAQADTAAAGAGLANPLPRTPDVLAHGRFVYENVCIACHGPKGAGDGHVAAVFTKPPSLMTQKVRDWPDGEIFHRPMRGQGSMPSHARQLDARDIWSVVHHIRVLQSQEPVAPATPTSAAAPGVTSGASAQAPGAPTSTAAPSEAPGASGRPVPVAPQKALGGRS